MPPALSQRSKGCFGEIKQMKEDRMKLKVITLVMVVFAACALQGETIINWGGTGMATADNNLSLPTPTDTVTARTWEYSATTPLLASGGTYAGPTIYGALQTENASDGPTNFSSALVDDKTGTNDDVITILLNSATNGDIVQGLVFFKKADFASLSGDTITFDSTSSFTLGVTGNQGGGGNRGPRLAVLDGSSWYISSSVFGGFNGSLTIADLSAENFASYDPTGAPLNGTPTSFTTAGSTFTDIQAVGYYFSNGTTSANKAGFNINNFQITAIPEPATLGLVGMAGALLLVFRCRMAH